MISNINESIDLSSYIEELENELKLTLEISCSNLLTEEEQKNTISKFLKSLIYTVFEEDEEKIKELDDKDFVIYAIKLAKEFIKYRQSQKEFFFSVNLAFLIIAEFEKNKLLYREFDEFYLLASACFITILNSIEDKKVLKDMFPSLPLKDLSLTELKEGLEEELFNGVSLPFSSFLFSLLFIFEEIPEIKIEWGEFEKLKTFENKPLNVEDIWGY
jgi:hypothetical protein